MMSDKKPDLTPFIEASRRGCKFFNLREWWEGEWREGGEKKAQPYFDGDLLPCDWKINHFAACVCIEWWYEWQHRAPFDEAWTLAVEGKLVSSVNFAGVMISKLRAFKREYGAE
jgi:hypothetical protein